MPDPPKNAGDYLSAARAGSRDALGLALEACRHYLLQIAHADLSPDLRAKAGASDLVQETFLEAQRDFACFHGGSEEELLAWLRRLLLNNVANFTRRYRDTAKRVVGREVQLELGSASDLRGGGIAANTPSPSGQAMAEEKALAIQQALERLPDDYRLVITLRNQERCSFEEIGARLNRSTDAARRLWSRAIERLQHELEASP
jgi:RNA polymerase sigma-70 factor (ECF subfamily)